MNYENDINLIKENLSSEKIFESSEKNKWLKMFKEKGLSEGYEILKEEYSKYETFGHRHSGAHLAGEIFYNLKGLGGISFCDSSFTFGCYHSFFILAINDYGLNVVKTLDDVCTKEYKSGAGECRHGIGHGIMQYMGHKNIMEALNICDEMTSGKLHGCLSGVFMEYNLQTKVKPGNTIMQVREKGDSPYYPCNSISGDEFKKSCYYEQNQWWFNIYDDYKKIENLCYNIEGEQYRDYCILGFGRMLATHTSYDPEKTVKICNSMLNRSAIENCKKGASWGFFAYPLKKHLASEVCESLPDNQVQNCIDDLDNI